MVFVEFSHSVQQKRMCCEYPHPHDPSSHICTGAVRFRVSGGVSLIQYHLGGHIVVACVSIVE